MASFACPNDGEELVVEVLQPATKTQSATEQYRCLFCRYSIDKATAASKLTATGSGYVAPSKVAAAPTAQDKSKPSKG